MIKMIVAVDELGGIGKNGVIPWTCPEDMKHFREKTLNQIVVMGYKTFASLGFKLLLKRKNFVFSRSNIHDIENNSFIDSIEEFMKMYKDFWVIGGNSVYKLFMPYIQELHITKIKGNYGCDVFFPFDELEKYKENIKIFEYKF